MIRKGSIGIAGLDPIRIHMLHFLTFCFSSLWLAITDVELN